MRIVSDTSSVVGKVSSSLWGQVIAVPGAYGVIEIEDEGGNAQKEGRRFLSLLTERLNDIPRTLSDLEVLADSLLLPSVKTLILLIPHETTVDLVVHGTGAVYLKRADFLSQLAHMGTALSGDVQKDDMLLLASRGFTTALSTSAFSSVFDHLSPTEVAEKLTLMLHKHEGGDGGAALLFHIRDIVESPEFGTDAIENTVPVRSSPIAHYIRRGRFLAGRVVSRVGTGRLPRLRSVKAHAATLKEKPRLLVVLVTGTLIVIFAISVILGIRKQTSNEQGKKALVAVAQAQQAFDEGVALRDLNALKSKERLTQAKQILDPFTSLPERSSEGRKVHMLSLQIAENLTLAQQIYKVDPQLFFDVSLLKKNAVVSSMAVSDDTLTLLDQVTKTVYTLVVSSKKGEILAGADSVTGASQIAVHGDTAYVWTSVGIETIGMVDKKTRQVIPKDSQWGSIVGLVSFGGNLYLLDTQKSRIWKYVALDKGFSETREYLNPDSLPDLSRALTMAIDGSVWIGTSDGKILRFTQGREATFIPQGIDLALGNNLAVFTSDEDQHVYVSDPDHKRVVVLDKEGLYIAQYTWESSIIPTNLVVTEAQKKILLLTDGKLYYLDLK